MSLGKQTVWVTGARGFIGRHLAKACAESGARVGGVGYGAWTDPDAERWGVANWVNGDVAQSSLGRLGELTGAPDVVFHLAGGSSVGASLENPSEDFRRSVLSTSHLLEWVKRHAPSAATVLASSAAVYGAGHDGPIPESATLQPFSPYGYHKRIAELLCESYARHYSLRVAIVRLFSVYGPELRKQLLWDLCSRLGTREARVTLAGTGRETRDWIHVSDAVACLVAAASHATPKAWVFNGGTGQGVSVADVAAVVARIWGGDRAVAFSGQQRPGDPHDLIADVRGPFPSGWTARVPWKQGIEEYVNWYRGAERPPRM